MRLPLSLLFTSLLLGGCAETPPTAPAPSTPVATAPVAAQSGLALSGQLRNAPPGSQLEVALLLVDARDRPLRTLASTRMPAQDGETPFVLHYQPLQLPADTRVELRARASAHGWLVRRLPPMRIDTQAPLRLGSLTLQMAP